MKTRVWELAKEMKISSKDLIKLAEEKKIVLKNALASIDKEEEKILKGAVSKPDVSKDKKPYQANNRGQSSTPPTSKNSGSETNKDSSTDAKMVDGNKSNQERFSSSKGSYSKNYSQQNKNDKYTTNTNRNQNRDNRDNTNSPNKGSYQNRDNTNSPNKGSYQNRDNTNNSSSYPNKGNYQNRDNRSNSSSYPNKGNYQNRDNSSTPNKGGYQNRDNTSNSSSYPNKGNYQNRDNSSTPNKGGYQNRDNTSNSSSYPNKGNYQNRDNSSTPNKGGYQNRDNSSSYPNKGNYQNRDNSSTPNKGGYQNRDNSSTPNKGGYQNRDNRDNRSSFQKNDSSKPPVTKDNRGSFQGKPKPKVADTPKVEDNQKDKRREDHNKKKKFEVKRKSFDSNNKPNKSFRSNSYNENYSRKRSRYKGKTKEDKERKQEQLQRNFLDKEIEISVPITLKDFSQVIGVRASDIINKLFASYGKMITINQFMDSEIIEAIALEFNRTIKLKENKDLETSLIEELEVKDSPNDLTPRGPVVTFLGHVDHGKTSLLDKIRNANVTAGEAGGITQHIGAYKVAYKGSSIVFLDTPGHEAFTSMRARGANITDIVVLIVAADDGVMPQTVEAINHAKAAKVPIIVALNKIDKEGSKPEATIQQLMKYDLIPDEWGGDTIFVKVSAITGAGIDELLEYLSLVAEMQGLTANTARKATGTVLEAKIKDGKGSVATLLVQNGTLKKGDHILCGGSSGRVRDIIDHKGKRLKEAGPVTPVEISGLSDLPDAGDKFYVVENLSEAKSIAETRQKVVKEEHLKQGSRKLTVEEIMKQIQEGETTELNLILKADVQGSVEAINHKLAEIEHDEIKIRVLHGAVGGINETDIQLASASSAIVLGFNVTPSKAARDLAEFKGVEIRRYSVIYHLLDDIKKVMTGMLKPEIREEIIGHVMIRKVIRISRYGNIAGCYVTDGIINRNSKIRVSRDGLILNKERPFELSSLKHHKDDVPKVKQGFECGIRLQGFDDFKEGDEMEVFQLVEVKRKLE